MNNLIFEQESYEIRGAIFEVYKELGAGFLESVYQEALELELMDHKMTFVAQHTLEINYKHHQLKQFYKPDFLCYNKIILEIKAVQNLLPEHEAQIINYLKATGLKLAFLVNFGHHPQVQIKRFVL
jgi:GxxExxY protein